MKYLYRISPKYCKENLDGRGSLKFVKLKAKSYQVKRVSARTVLAGLTFPERLCWEEVKS